MKKQSVEHLLNLTQFSLAIGLSHQRIGQLVESGKVKRRPDKFFDLNDKINKAFIHVRRLSFAPKDKKVPPSMPAAGEPPAGPIAPPPEISRAEIERRKAFGQLEKLRLQNAKAAGRLVDRPAVLAFASHLVSILNSEFLSLGQRLSADLAAIARKAASDDEAAVALDAYLQPELYAIVRHSTSTTRTFVRELYDESTGEVAAPILVVRALEEVRALLDKAIAEVREREAA